MWSYFNCWPWDIWEPDFSRQNTWTGNILVEVQEVSPACFGTWAVGIENVAASAHLPEHLEKFRPQHQISSQYWTQTDWETNLCTTISVSLLSRTSRLTYFWIAKPTHFTKVENVLRNQAGKHVSLISQTWCVLHVLEKTDASLRLQAIAQKTMTQTHVSYHRQWLRSFGERHSTDQQVKKRTSHDREWRWTGFAFIMWIKVTSVVQPQCVERWLQRCAGSVSALRWISWQAMETKLLIIALLRLLVFQHTNVHYFSFGLTGWSTLLHKHESSSLDLHQKSGQNTSSLVLTMI